MHAAALDAGAEGRLRTLRQLLDLRMELMLSQLPPGSAELTSAGRRACGMWSGAALAPNGKLYFIPYSSYTALIVDPATSTYNDVSLTGFTGANKWDGGVLGSNGKVYGIPSESQSVLVIDPATDSATTQMSGLAAGTKKWRGGVLAPSGVL